MINTIAEGYNSGRTYYLQANSKEQCQEMVKLIKVLVKRACEMASAQTQFSRVQLRARKVYKSHLFQSSSATLILAVGALALLFYVFLLTSLLRTSRSAYSSPSMAKLLLSVVGLARVWVS